MSATITTYQQLLQKVKDTGHDVRTIFSVFASAEQEKRYKKLRARTKTVSFFEVEGEYFKGDLTIAILRFVLDNPDPADFLVWLQKNFDRYDIVK